MKKSKNKTKNWKVRLRSWGVQFVVMLALLFAIEAFMTRDVLGIIAPEIEAMTLEQQPFSLEQFKGKAAVVHFWATWCPVCELEQSKINELSTKIPIITVAMQSGVEAEVSDYLAQQGVNYPVINDEMGTLSRSYGVRAVPMSFILDRKGKVRFATRGYTTGWGVRIRLWLAGI